MSTEPKPIRKVLVANRAEIAIRVFQTCHRLGIKTVAVYSKADSDAPHRHEADEAVLIGEAAASESYLVIDRILAAAKLTGADAIHPGYGFLSENAEFARAVEAAGLIFIGPTADSILSMGDKIEARRLMQAAGMPVVPGTDAPVALDADLKNIADKIGYPLLVKAAGGGGGKGIRRVNNVDELENAVERATSEAGSAFGDARVYLERLIENARHIEAQVFGDGLGGACFLGERECSLQRNHQKVLEEAPSCAIDDELRAEIREAAIRGVRAINYRGAGTFEFLFDENRREFYFLEMNTRLQVEHPVTEMVIRMDLVEEQLRIAAGGTLAGFEEPPMVGHSIELRIYAEDPYRGFVPSTGKITSLRLPHAPFSRIDHALREHYEVPPYYDPMLAKVIVWGQNRDEAISRLQALLKRIRISGIHSSVPLGLDICRWQKFRDGDFDTHSLETWLAEHDALPTEQPDLLTSLAGMVVRDFLSRNSEACKNKVLDFDPGSWGRTGRRVQTGRMN